MQVFGVPGHVIRKGRSRAGAVRLRRAPGRRGRQGVAHGRGGGALNGGVRLRLHFVRTKVGNG